MDSFVTTSQTTTKKKRKRHQPSVAQNKDDDGVSGEDDEKEIITSSTQGDDDDDDDKIEERQSNSHSTKKKKKNAFDLLMSSPKKQQQRHGKRQRTSINTTTTTKSKPGVTTTTHKSTGDNASGNSRFLECPICHSHVLGDNISLHLDTLCTGIARRDNDDCKEKERDNEQRTSSKALLSEQQQQHALERRSNDAKENIYHDDNDNEKHETNSSDKDDNKNKIIDNTANAKSSLSKIAPKPNTNHKIFEHLMNQSRLLSPQQQKQQLIKEKEERFHMHHDGTLSWTTTIPTTRTTKNYENEKKQVVIDNSLVDVQWSSNVNIRDGKTTKSVVISSSLPSSSASELRLVQTHSRLSVPVLKSLLQKSVRRRKPLPSVRIACELIDKAWNEFIRRFPIIVLEDSFLNHDYDLLIWLMIASSKDYVPQMSIIQRVLSIVYEVAACPWRDDCDQQQTPQSCSSNVAINPGTKEPELLKENQEQSAPKISQSPSRLSTDENIIETKMFLSKDELWIKCMHIRKCYGGMSCDIKMISKFIDIWQKRLFQWKCSSLPSSMGISKETIISAPERSTKNEGNECSLGEDCNEINHNSSFLSVQTSATKTISCLWSNLPKLLHQRSKQQARQHLSPIFTRMEHGKHAIDKLSASDLCLAGVDFHCTSVLDDILRDDSLYEILCKTLEHLMPVSLKDNLGASGDNGGFCSVMKNKQRREFIVNTMKSCMWKYSSSLNHKMLLIEQYKLLQGIEGDHHGQNAPQNVKCVSTEEESDVLKDRALLSAWEKHIRPCVDIYAKKYLNDRI